MDLQTIKTIHSCIHDKNCGGVEINGKEYKIEEKREIRRITVEGISFYEQDKNSGSVMAKEALSGHKITWGETLTGNWILVRDEEVISY